MAENSDEILHDFFPMARVYKDGRIERLLGQDIVPPSLDPTSGVQSKDVEIAPEMNLSARLFLPPNASPGQKLPLLVYFHGGGFIVQSAFSAPYHKHLNHLVAEADVIAVSVNYRLAPEHPLPMAFEDSWHCLKWAASQSTNEGGEEWIKEYADSDRVYLGGDSAGANIAHKLAMRAGSEKPEGFNLRGIFLNCPFFWGVDLLGNEADHPMKGLAVIKNLWFVVCPGMIGHDEPWINPGKDPNVSRLGCKKVLIYVGEKDMLRERGWYYKEVLKKSGWDGEVECVEAAGEDHVFSVFSPDSGSSLLMFRKRHRDNVAIIQKRVSYFDKYTEMWTRDMTVGEYGRFGRLSQSSDDDPNDSTVNITTNRIKIRHLIFQSLSPDPDPEPPTWIDPLSQLGKWV